MNRRMLPVAVAGPSMVAVLPSIMSLSDAELSSPRSVLRETEPLPLPLYGPKTVSVLPTLLGLIGDNNAAGIVDRAGCHPVRDRTT
jgi:hypothetical protein